MLEKVAPARNIIRRRTFLEATKGNRRTINHIEEELQDVLSVRDSVRDNVIGRMNSIVDEARTKLTGIAVECWSQDAPRSEKISETEDGDLEDDIPVGSAVDATLTDEIYESKKARSCMWLDIITDERMNSLKQKKKPLDGMGLEYISARELSFGQPRGQGQYSALGGAYIRFIPQRLTLAQRKELDLLTDSWDAFLAMYNSLTLKYKDMLQKDGSVLIPGGPMLYGKSETGDKIWDDFMDTNKVRTPTLVYIMRNLNLFWEYYHWKGVKGPASNWVADTVVHTALKGVPRPNMYTNPVANVINNVPKRIYRTVPRSIQGQNLEFQAIVPTFYVDVYGQFRILASIVDADHTVMLTKFTVNAEVLKFVFSITNPVWIEQGRHFVNETMQHGTNAELATDAVPW